MTTPTALACEWCGLDLTDDADALICDGCAAAFRAELVSAAADREEAEAEADVLIVALTGRPPG